MSQRESHDNWQNFEPLTQATRLEQRLNAERQGPQCALPAATSSAVAAQGEVFEGGLGI